MDYFPPEIHLGIARFLEKDDLSSMRLVGSKYEMYYSEGVFKDVCICAPKEEFMARLSQFCDWSKKVEGDRTTQRVAINEYVRSAKIILLKDTPYDSGDSTDEYAHFAPIVEHAPSAFGTTDWDKQLNTRPRRTGVTRLRWERPLVTLLLEAVSLMTGCTRLELAAYCHIDIKNPDLQIFQAMEPWSNVTSLRMKLSIGGELEKGIIARLVPNVRHLQIEDFGDLGTGEPSSWRGGLKASGQVFKLAEKHHAGLKRLHILLADYQRHEDIFPRMDQLRRIAASFPELEWLGVDTEGYSHDTAPDQPDNLSDLLRNKAEELAKTLRHFKNLKRVAVRADGYKLGNGRNKRQNTPSYMWLAKHLSSMMHDVEVAIIRDWPAFYTARWSPMLTKSISLGHRAAEHRGWPLCLRDTPTSRDDINFAYKTIGFPWGPLKSEMYELLDDPITLKHHYRIWAVPLKSDWVDDEDSDDGEYGDDDD